MVARIEKEMEEKGLVGVRGILQKGSLSNILESVFGSCLSCHEREELGNMVEEGYELLAKFNWEDFFPFIKFLDLDGVKRRCHKLAAKVNGVVGQIVKDRKGDGVFVVQNQNNDFLTALLCLPKEERLGDSDMVAILWVSISYYLSFFEFFSPTHTDAPPVNPTQWTFDILSSTIITPFFY